MSIGIITKPPSVPRDGTCLFWLIGVRGNHETMMSECYDTLVN